jgi:prevent-host-death family protein
MNWQLQDAKNRLSELVNRALSEGPQTITRHGAPTVVVMDFKDFTQQSGREKLSTVLHACPVKGWKVSRDKDEGRSLRLS